MRRRFDLARMARMAAVAAVPVAISGTAYAWDSPEHTAFGEAALAAA